MARIEGTIDMTRAAHVAVTSMRHHPGVRRVMAILATGRLTAAEAADALGVSRWTVYRRCKALDIAPTAARAEYLRRLVASVTARISSRRAAKGLA
jgi:hypothetical protein